MVDRVAASVELQGGEYELDVVGRPDSRDTIEIADDSEQTVDLRIAR